MDEFIYATVFTVCVHFLVCGLLFLVISETTSSFDRSDLHPVYFPNGKPRLTSPDAAAATIIQHPVQHTDELNARVRSQCK